MAKREIPPPAHFVTLDERWMREWIKFGFKEIDASLERHAAFDQYVKTHPPSREKHAE
jgi:hypothetical protein